MKFDHNRDFLRIVLGNVLDKVLTRDLDPHDIHSRGKEKREFLVENAPLMYGCGATRDLTKRPYLLAAQEFGKLFRIAIYNFEHLPY